VLITDARTLITAATYRCEFIAAMKTTIFLQNLASGGILAIENIAIEKEKAIAELE
jgi:hypothetical protein